LLALEELFLEAVRRFGEIAMVSASRKRIGVPPKPKKRELLREWVEEWHAATIGTLARMQEIAIEMLEELGNGNSPLHDIIDDPSALSEFVNQLSDVDSRLTFLLVDNTPPETDCCIPNPMDVLK
jgi:hypothetical protein